MGSISNVSGLGYILSTRLVDIGAQVVQNKRVSEESFYRPLNLVKNEKREFSNLAQARSETGILHPRESDNISIDKDNPLNSKVNIFSSSFRTKPSAEWNDPIAPILGLWTPVFPSSNISKSVLAINGSMADRPRKVGKLAVFADSTCLDSTHLNESMCEYFSINLNQII
ncbi:unnamed protein product [Protopolystoma xenopodis]|uniref:Uncharacterized protein n=1 Tax=Protopolystoma xenopodis TaxID=117903 RepID=A0A3S5B155_9PLAT|nr:unnamed protein product [Protopolystoma xenopodis]